MLERMPAGAYQKRPFLLGFQGFPTLDELGLLERVRAGGRDIAPGPDGVPTAICIEVGKLLAAIGEDVPVAHERSVTALLREDGRVTGVVAEGPDGPQEIPADLVVACDGMHSPVRAMAGLQAEVRALADATLTWMSPVVIDRSFGMRYLSDGGQMGLMGWPEGSAGWRTIDRVGREAAMAPGVEAFRASFAALMPEAAEALEGVTSTGQLLYQEPAVLRAARWWAPGVVLIGDAAHFFGPETGVGAGLGLGDAHALARAHRRRPRRPGRRVRPLRDLAGARHPPLRGGRPRRRADERAERRPPARGALAAGLGARGEDAGGRDVPPLRDGRHG